MANRILNGWKEISSHLDRGVRTAQRWEHFFGMPVHRPACKQRAAVIALTDEIDIWLRHTMSEVTALPDGRDRGNAVRLRDELSRLQAEAQQLSRRVAYLENRDLHQTHGGVDGVEGAGIREGTQSTVNAGQRASIHTAAMPN